MQAGKISLHGLIGPVMTQSWAVRWGAALL